MKMRTRLNRPSISSSGRDQFSEEKLNSVR